MSRADELRDVGAKLVYDIDRVETDATAAFVSASRCDELLALRWRKEADRTIDRYGRFVVQVRDDRHGEVGEREHRTTHHRAICIQVLWGDGHFADSMVRTSFNDRTLCLSSESILREIRLDLF